MQRLCIIYNPLYHLAVLLSLLCAAQRLNVLLRLRRCPPGRKLETGTGSLHRKHPSATIAAAYIIVAMKLATALSIILLPVVSVTADTYSVNKARSANPNLRGGHTHHHHETGSLIKEFREQRVHKKDVQDEEVDSDNAIVDNAVGVDGGGIAASGNESVGPGKYFNEQQQQDNNGSDYSRHEKSLAARKKKAQEQQHQQIFRTSRLSRTEMESKAKDMESKLIQVEEGTLQLSSKTIERYKKFVARYNELEKEIYHLNHPEEKKKDEEESMANDAKNKVDGKKGDTEMNKKTTSSAYSSGKAEYEKSIEQMKEKKEIDELIHKEKKVMEVGEEEKKGKEVMDVTNTDADKADVFPEKEKVSTKTMEVVGEEKPSSKYADRDTVDDDEIIDSLEIPSEQNGKIKGEITVTGGVSKEDDDDDDIPPNFEGLVDEKASDPLNKAASKEIGSTKQLSVPADISVENSVEKVKKLVEIVDTTPKKKMADDIESSTVSTQLKEGGSDNESEDAGTVEMDRAVLEKLSSEKGNADGESESSKGEKKASVGN